MRKHLPLPKKNLGQFWKKESFFLKKLIKLYPDERFWLKVNFKSIVIKLKFGTKEQQLYSFAQFFAWPFKDGLRKETPRSLIISIKKGRG